MAKDAMDGFEVAQFLRQLPRMPLEDVPKENRKCPIYHIEYLDDDPDSGYTEYPVRLPCKHLVGRHCITT